MRKVNIISPSGASLKDCANRFTLWKLAPIAAALSCLTGSGVAMADWTEGHRGAEGGPEVNKAWSGNGSSGNTSEKNKDDEYWTTSDSNKTWTLKQEVKVENVNTGDGRGIYWWLPKNENSTEASVTTVNINADITAPYSTIQIKAPGNANLSGLKDATLNIGSADKPVTLTNKTSASQGIKFEFADAANNGKVSFGTLNIADGSSVIVPNYPTVLLNGVELKDINNGGTLDSRSSNGNKQTKGAVEITNSSLQNLKNTGKILGRDYGIHVNGNSTVSSITNAGTISAERGDGIIVDSSSSIGLLSSTGGSISAGQEKGEFAAIRSNGGTISSISIQDTILKSDSYGVLNQGKISSFSIAGGSIEAPSIAIVNDGKGTIDTLTIDNVDVKSTKTALHNHGTITGQTTLKAPDGQTYTVYNDSLMADIELSGAVVLTNDRTTESTGQITGNLTLQDGANVSVTNSGTMNTLSGAENSTLALTNSGSVKDITGGKNGSLTVDNQSGTISSVTAGEGSRNSNITNGADSTINKVTLQNGANVSVTNSGTMKALSGAENSTLALTNSGSVTDITGGKNGSLTVDNQSGTISSVTA
ncbi:hypothetical protein, partial [Escherichia coli]|uniref:hypothetical protein n=1 Tax=Escherichia coli TaxID=562 RepID=UPI0029E7DADE